MDISDILDQFDSSNVNNLVPYDENLFEQAVGTEPSGEEDLRALTRAWVNERATTELLEWPQDGLITRCRTRVKDQIDLVERLTGNMDPKKNFSLIIIQTDVERWKFMIRSYLRTRLAKIQKFTLHYLSSPELQAHLSDDESAYAIKYQQILHQHFLNSFLGKFPVNLQNLNDTAGGISMIEAPDEEASIFARGLGSRDGGDTVHVTGRGRNENGEIGIARGEVVVAKWSDVREFVKKGEMELV
ncbi:hypothetical protein EPUL_003357 [Erysiphe pulchra]|uniref:DNA replication complex GINS protein SLD5 n=1 Tax=Erysiphe pulchra TaxID=225359 RepID=A0A2S4PZ79_9PEZI|nr:hypothetical protein EPUL_003357 [Erysiphe pulchra]